MEQEYQKNAQKFLIKNSMIVLGRINVCFMHGSVIVIILT